MTYSTLPLTPQLEAVVVDVSYREIKVLNHALARYALRPEGGYPLALAPEAQHALDFQDITMDRINEILRADKANEDYRHLLSCSFTLADYEVAKTAMLLHYDVAKAAMLLHKDYLATGDGPPYDTLTAKLDDAELAIAVLRAEVEA